MLHPLASKLFCVLCCPLHCMAGLQVCLSLSAFFFESGGLDASAAGPGFACKGHAGYLALFFAALLACSANVCVGFVLAA